MSLQDRCKIVEEDVRLIRSKLIEVCWWVLTPKFFGAELCVGQTYRAKIERVKEEGYRCLREMESQKQAVEAGMKMSDRLRK